ncbi:hypothetical protein HQQ81_07075 [Microbacteriaceae bacterium VKM Ac-2854]|nr:hypothetical protein [Microbacteriaceae bacterium VKM Ac-2854]
MIEERIDPASQPEPPKARLRERVFPQLVLGLVLSANAALNGFSGRADEAYLGVVAIVVALAGTVLAVQGVIRWRRIVIEQRAWERDRLAEREAEERPFSPVAPATPPTT